MVQYQIERPKFQRLIQRGAKVCSKQMIVLCRDRLSRNQVDDTVIRKLMKMGIEVQFEFAKNEETSSGALHMDNDWHVFRPLFARGCREGVAHHRKFA